MKKILIFAGLLLVSIPGFSQTYMDKIVKSSCECISSVPDSLDKDKFNMQFGLCMINASMPYKKELKRDYNINLDHIDNKEGQKLGTVVALKMGAICPDGLLKVANINKAIPEQETSEKTMEGIVTNIEDTNFVVFSVKDDLGRLFKFYWFQVIQSDTELTNTYNSLLGKTIKLTYDKKEYFDPKITDYRQYNVISKIENVKN